MATSGTITYTETRNTIIEGALKLIGRLAEGENPSNEQIIDGQKTLNRMIKAWTNQGIHIWKYAEASLFLTDGTSSYTVGSGGTAHVTETYYSTALASDAASGASTITVDDDDDITDGDYIGIVLDDDSIQWTTVNGTPAANVVTLTDTLTGTASTDNIVYNYTNKINKPESIQNIRRYNITSEISTPIYLVSRSEYMQQSNKTTEAKVNLIYYDKQRLSGTFYLWPTPDSDSEEIIKLSFQKPFEVFDSAADDPDVPAEWQEALVYNLAVRLCHEYGVALQERQLIRQEADQYLREAMMYDREPVSIYVQPNLDESGYAGNIDED